MPLGRQVRFTAQQFMDIEKMLLTTTLPIAQIAARTKVRFKKQGKWTTKAVSPPSINHWFPMWRSKTAKERAAWRKAHPLPTIES